MRKEDVDRDFDRILEEQPDIGVGKIISTWFLEPPNTFDPNSRKKPKPETIIVLAYIALMAVACIAFNST
jgi:hypothetical protein